LSIGDIHHMIYTRTLGYY